MTPRPVASVRAGGACRFSLRHYTETLAAYTAAGYAVVGCAEALDLDAARRVVVMRHDIDVDPESVRPLLAAEARLGVRSTTFVRPRAPGYRAGDHVDLWRYCADHGFEIGLHYDSGGADPTAGLALQRGELERTIGRHVLGASSHRPATTGWTLAGADVGRLGFGYEAYELVPRLGLKYISDSARRWREGCFCEWIGRAERLQVLVHPEWWRPGSLRRRAELLALL